MLINTLCIALPRILKFRVTVSMYTADNEPEVNSSLLRMRSLSKQEHPRGTRAVISDLLPETAFLIRTCAVFRLFRLEDHWHEPVVTRFACQLIKPGNRYTARSTQSHPPVMQVSS